MTKVDDKSLAAEPAHAGTTVQLLLLALQTLLHFFVAFLQHLLVLKAKHPTK